MEPIYADISLEERGTQHQSPLWQQVRQKIWTLEHSRGTQFKNADERKGWYAAFHALERLCNREGRR